VVTGGALDRPVRPDVSTHSAMHWSMRAGYRASGLGIGAGRAPRRGGWQVTAVARVWPEQT
jgi:hypothetical protein